MCRLRNNDISSGDSRDLTQHLLTQTWCRSSDLKIFFTFPCMCRSIIKKCAAQKHSHFFNEKWHWSEEGMSKNKLSQENKMHF